MTDAKRLIIPGYVEPEGLKGDNIYVTFLTTFRDAYSVTARIVSNEVFDYSESWSGSRVIRTTEIDRGLTEDIRMVEPLEKLAELNGAEIDYSNLIKQGCVLAHMRRNVQATLNYFRTYNQRDTRQRDTTPPQGL